MIKDQHGMYDIYGFEYIPWWMSWKVKMVAGVCATLLIVVVLYLLIKALIRHLRHESEIALILKRLEKKRLFVMSPDISSLDIIAVYTLIITALRYCFAEVVRHNVDHCSEKELQEIASQATLNDQWGFDVVSLLQRAYYAKFALKIESPAVVERDVAHVVSLVKKVCVQQGRIK